MFRVTRCAGHITNFPLLNRAILFVMSKVMVYNYGTVYIYFCELQIRDCVDKYARLFTFSTHNMRNSKLREVRLEWNQSRLLFIL